MKKKRLAVCDSDPLYASNLADYINRTTNMPCEAAAFTDLESYEKYAQCAPVDILLLNPEMLEDGEWEEKVTAEIIFLSDEVSEEGRDKDILCAPAGSGKHRCVNKYQSADRLLDDIRIICRQEEERQVQPASSAAAKKDVFPVKSEAEAACEKLDLLAVYSPVGRCGKTIFSVAMGETLARTKKVLYLNMESYSALDCEDIRIKGDISDLVFSMRKGEKDILPRLRSMVCTFRNLDYLPPVRTISDLKEIRYSEWMQLIAAAGHAGYETIILDAGGQTGDLFEVLSSCSRIYVPYLKDPVSQIKTDRFRENLRLCGMAELERKMDFLLLPQSAEEELRDYPMRAVRGKIGTFVKRIISEKRGGSYGSL